MSTEPVPGIERLLQVVDELKNENLELKQVVAELTEQVSQLTKMLCHIDDSSALFADDEDDDDSQSDDDDEEPVEGPIDEEADCEENSKWLPLKGFNDYVIKNYFPYEIKRVSKNRVVKECKSNGYISMNLVVGNKRKTLGKHILIARQFIPNDDPKNKRFVDHKNKHRDDYHISNLRWVTASENGKNKSSCRGVDYEYVTEIPGDAIVVDSYGKHTFEDYYFHDNKFYFHNGIEYRVLYICTDKKNGSKYVYAVNTDGKQTSIYYSKFKRLYGLSE